MKKLQIFFVVVAATMFMCAGIKAQQLEFFLMKDGLQEAKNNASNTLTNPVLVVAVAIDNVNEQGLQFKMIYEGADIGKSNNWVFAFAEEGNVTKTAGFTVLKMYGMLIATPTPTSDFVGYFSLSNPIDESQLVDSDEFIKSLISNPDFRQVSADTVANIGIFTLDPAAIGRSDIAPCFSTSENRYLYFTQDYYTESIYSCCFAPYFDVSEVECEWYIGIEENTIATHLIISPNPTNSDAIASFGLLENGDITIEVCDLLGNVFYSVSDFYDIGEHSVSLDIKGIPSGNYLCRLLSKDKQIGTTSFIVEK